MAVETNTNQQQTNQTQQQATNAPDNQSANQQAQQQVNQHNDPGTDQGEVTVELLMAQLAQANAANAKLKADNDKLCASEGNLRKQLRQKQTAEELEAEAKAEQEAQQKNYVAGLEKRLSIIEATNRYLDLGMEKELAEATAVAEIEGNRELVNANIKKYQADWRQKTEASLRAQLLKDMPVPSSGNQSQVDFSKQFQQAISAGDAQAAALAILQQAEANGGFKA